MPLQPNTENPDRDEPPRKIRPIAMGELLTRLAGELALHVLTPTVRAIFGCLQVAIVVCAPGGSQAAATANLQGVRNGHALIISDLRTRSTRSVVSMSCEPWSASQG